MADTKNFPPWTAQDEVIMCKQEIAQIKRDIAKAPVGSWVAVLQMNLADAEAELAKWEARCK